MSKLFFFDLETTGVKHWKNGIHQISAIVEIDGVEKDRIDLKIQPNPACIIEDQALKIADVTREDLAGYMPFKEGYKALTKVLSKYVNKFDKNDKFTLVGFNNSSFDNPFLRAFFVQNDDKYFGSWFRFDSADVVVLASRALVDKRASMPNFKLMTVARAFDLDVEDEKLHDALYDVHLTREIFNKIEVTRK